MKLGIAIGVVCIVAGVAGLGVMYSRSRTDGRFGETKADVTRMKVQKFAHEALPQWSKHNANKPCPGSITELNDYMNGDDSNDEWGSPMKLLCSGRSVVVVSAGEDGREGTTDDIRSDQP